jgi:hypothetical protein
MLPNNVGLSHTVDTCSESSSMPEYRTRHPATEELARPILGTCFVQHAVTTTDSGHRNIVSHITINVLPDEVLLGIFDFYVREGIWQTLVHVSRRWRCIVFGAPRRLNLQLVCTAARPVREMLDIWPALPIVLRISDAQGGIEDNVVAALEQNGRVCEIYVEVLTSGGHLSGVILELMGASFPELTHVDLMSYHPYIRGGTLVIPDSFLSGSAPRLQSFCLKGVVFPTLRKLLLSATGLVRLRLEDTPSSGHFSPEKLADCIASLTRLEDFAIQTRFCVFRLDRAHHIHTVLPMLTTISFEGQSEYWEDLFACLDAPLLNRLIIKFQAPTTFDISRISLILGVPEPFTGFRQAELFFDDDFVEVALSQGATTLMLSFVCRYWIWHLRYLTQSSHLFDDGRELNYRDPLIWRHNPKNAWLDLLHFFTTVENLYLSEELASRVALALQELDSEQVTVILPALKYIFIESLGPSGPVQFEKFIVARELSGHPVAVQPWWRRSNG